MLTPSLRLARSLVLVPLGFAAACGGGDSDAASGAATSGGSAGATGASAGKSGSAGSSAVAGAAGKAGGAGASGAAGAAGGVAGGAGTGGSAGKAGGPGGSGGAAGTSGGAGTGGAGAGGGGCKVAADCAVPTSLNPPGCAVASCDATSHLCQLLAVDADGDGHRTKKCTDTKGATVVVGDDCDDSDPKTFPTAWDGPKDASHPDRCDGTDQDCNGKPDDGIGAGGATCTCAPGDVVACKEDSSGKPISYPPGALQGVCKFGSKTCLANGMFGPCTDARGPSPEVCDGLDNDCNGKKDDNPTDPILWAYDGDNDGHGAAGCDPVYSCVQTTPNAFPTGCAGPNQPGTCTTCAPTAWKHASAIPSDDCNDNDPAINPASAEICDDKDNNCNAQVDEGFALGTACDVNGIHEGACLGGGTLACAPDHSAKCFPPPGVTIPADFAASAAPNGSFDWNCDGIETHEFDAVRCKKTSEAACDADLANSCLGLTPRLAAGPSPMGPR